MASTSAPPKASTEANPERERLRLPAPVKTFLTRAGKQAHRFTEFAGKQATRLTEFVGLKKEDRHIISRGQNHLEVSAQGTDNRSMSPEAKRIFHLSLRVGVGILAAVVTLKAGGALTGGSNRKKGKPTTKGPAYPVKPGVKMAEDMNKKARAAAASVEHAVSGASQSMVKATSEVKGAAVKATDGAKTAAGKTKVACLKTKDACLKAVSGVKEAAEETKAICDAALEGAKKQIQASNEKKRKEAAKWAEKQPKRKQKKVDSSSLKSVMPPQEAKEPSEPQKTLEFVKDLLTDKVERLYFHVFP